LLRNTRKRDKTKKIRGKTDTEIFVDFFGESFRIFDMDFLQKCFYGVFELPLPRKAQKAKTHFKKIKARGGEAGRWVTQWVDWSGIWQMYGGERRFFCRPLMIVAAGQLSVAGEPQTRRCA
jgi:hypothetical protein